MNESSLTEVTNPSYLAKNDTRSFFDIEKGFPVLSVQWDDWSKQRFKRFLDFFLGNFPMPPMAKKELSETEDQYNLFSDLYRQFQNPYLKWAEQCYLYILKGYRVGIPYLKNIQGELKPNLPPLRYRHWEDMEMDGSLSFYGTIKLVTGIRKVLGFNASHDVCNNYFDYVIRNEGKRADLWLDVMKTSNVVSFSHPVFNYNADQSWICNAALLTNSVSPTIKNEIYKLWGTKSDIGVNFPTMWYPRGNNLYGDGSKTDPYFAIKGFPRFHEDFQNNKISVNLGLTSEYDKPGQEILKDVHDFFTRSEPFKLSDKQSILKINSWYSENNRWNKMRKWLLDNCPEMLFYYYSEWSQKNASHHIDYLQAIGAMIYTYVASWMVTPTKGFDFVPWYNQMKKPSKDKSDSSYNPASDPHPDKGALSLAVKQPDGSYRWEIAEKDIRYKPPDYGKRSQVPRLQSLYSKQMLDLRDLWRDSWTGYFSTNTWIDKIPIFPNVVEIFTENFNNMLKVSEEEYVQHGFNFIKEYPLASPIMPPGYVRHEVYSYDTEKYKVWLNACNKQWDFYMIWVASNINAVGKPGYIKPNSNEAIAHNAAGRPIYNQIPDIGILDPIQGLDTLKKIGHILTFGLSEIWGDSWWNELLNFLKATFDWLVDKLYEIAKYIGDHIPEIGTGLLIFGGILLGGYALSQYVGEEARIKAHG